MNFKFQLGDHMVKAGFTIKGSYSCTYVTFETFKNQIPITLPDSTMAAVDLIDFKEAFERIAVPFITELETTGNNFSPLPPSVSLCMSIMIEMGLLFLLLLPCILSLSELATVGSSAVLTNAKLPAFYYRYYIC